MTCCFVGHRRIARAEDVEKSLRATLHNLIEQGVTRFIFGDHSEFNTLCYEIVTELKKEIPQIRRIHYRIDYPDADDYTLQFLLDGYEDSVCPVGVAGAGKAVYVKRNQAMIHDSDICVFYFNDEYMPPTHRVSERTLTSYQPKSGTRLTYEYAQVNGKEIINVYRSLN